MAKDDPAIAAAAAYWDARDELSFARREDRGAWFEASSVEKIGSSDATEQADAIRSDAARAYGHALRKLDAAMKELASVAPNTTRGGVEMLTAALAEFSEPFDNLGSKKVLCDAIVMDLLRSLRDAMELWAVEPPTLKAGEPE